MSFDKEKNTRIPLEQLLQGMTDAFIKNNRLLLQDIVIKTAADNNISEGTFVMDDVIDKAVFASMFDLVTGRLMESDKSVHDLVYGHIKSVLEG